MDSPNGIVKKKLKRRSSSMFNLIEHKNLVEKDMENCKINIIRKNNQARRNFRNDLVVKNRNIDFQSIYEDSPVIQRSREPITRDFKIEAMDIAETTSKIDCNIKTEAVVPSCQPSSELNNTSRMNNIKNKINLLKNNFRNIISTKKSQEPVVSAVKPESKMPIVPRSNVEQSRFLNPEKINEQHKRLTQHNRLMRASSSTSNLKPRQALGNAQSNQNIIEDQWKKSLRSSTKNQAKPVFKLSTKITYNDSHLFKPQQPSESEVVNLYKLINKRKIASHIKINGSLTSLNTIN